MFLDTRRIHDASLSDASALPECFVDSHANMSAFMEHEVFISRARESPVPFMMCFGEHSVQATMFEPLKGFYLGICGPESVVPAYEWSFFCDQPYSVFMLLLKGRYTCTMGEGEGVRFDIGEKGFLAGDWHDTCGRSGVAVPGEWSHVALAVSSEAVEEHFGPGLSRDMERILHYQEDGAARRPPTMSGIASPDLICVGRRLLSMRNSGSLGVMEIRSASLDFFTRILRNAASPHYVPVTALPEHDVQALTRLKERIDRNCLEQTGIKELCASVRMSESKANKGFKQLFNITISGYVHNCKMQYAHAMLRARKRNVSECAFAIGYTNIGHFIAAYRKHYDQTPGQTFRLAP